MMRSAMEIERKYLIRMPDEGMLKEIPGCEKWEIVQTYLKDCGNGSSKRVRRICVDGREKYIRTEKRRVSALSCEESEGEISAGEYAELMKERDPALNSIEKKRYRVPYAGRTLEIDIYSFWNDRATLEIELEREDEQPEIPDWLDVVRELTGEAAYKNLYLAREVPMEALP